MGMTANRTIYDSVHALPWARLGVRVEAGRITEVALSTGDLTEALEAVPLAQQARRLLADYLQGGGRWPDQLPLEPAGTSFQQRVWRLLRTIPPGQTRTYGELAQALSTSPRAVGGACRANPIVLLIPCHRVVAVDGEGGFAGQREGTWPAIKHRLLQLEGAVNA